MRRRYKPRNSGWLDTFVTIDGEEMDVSAHWEYQPAEEDTNTAEGIEVTTVESKKAPGCIMYKLSDDEIDALHDRVWSEIQEYTDDEY